MKRSLAASEKGQAVLRRYQGERERQLNEDFMALMNVPNGRRVLRHLVLEVCALHRLSFNQASAQFAFNDGRRSVGVELKAAIDELCPELWLTGEQEALAEKKRWNANQQAAQVAAQGDDE